MPISKRFLPPIPKGHRIFCGDVEVVGIQHHQHGAISFIKGKDHEIVLELEPRNKFDPNAIIVYGITKGFFGRKVNKVGYIPAEVSKIIAEQSMFTQLAPRLRNLYMNDDGFCAIRLDLIGPK